MEKVLSLQEAYVSPPVLRIEGVLRRWCRFLATTGGIMLTALTMITVASVLRRSIFGTPIPGDFELVELGVAVAVSFFLPYCQIYEGNVIVDLFTAKASPGVIHILGAIGDLLFLIISAVICWRVFLGCLEYREYQEVTMVLKIPIWWAMAPMVLSFALLTLTCACTMLAHLLAPRSKAAAKEEEAIAASSNATQYLALDCTEVRK